MKHKAKFINNKSQIQAELEHAANKPKPCTDCGKSCVKRVVYYRKNTLPSVHWKIKCVSCNMWKNPENEQFDCTADQVRRIWTNILR